MLTNNTKRYLLIGALLLVLFGIWLGSQFVQKYGKQELTIEVLPTYAKIVINETPYEQGVSYIKPGEYPVTISANDFESEVSTLVVKSGENASIEASLLPNTPLGNKWVSEHSKLYRTAEEKGAERSVQKGQELSEMYPIVDDLPYRGSNYSIGYKTPDGTPESFVVTIHATGSLERRLSVSALKNLGYDPAELPIDFVNFDNPLAKENGNE